MEIDKSVIIVTVILFVVLGIFVVSQMGGGVSGNAVSSGVNYASQYSGGGCGR